MNKFLHVTTKTMLILVILVQHSLPDNVQQVNYQGLSCLLMIITLWTIMSQVGCSPAISPPGLHHKLKFGNTLNLTCHLECDMATTLSYDWIQTLSTGESLVISSQPDLIIDNVDFDNTGQVQCYVHLDDRSLASESVTVSVVGPPYIDNDEDIANITANVGDNLDIEIYFCSRPPASASWVVRMEETSDNQLMLLSGRKHGRFSTQTRW